VVAKPDLEGCLAVCSRPSGQQQRRPDGRTSCDDNAVHKVGDCWQIVGAVYWQCQTVACRGWPDMIEPYAGDDDIVKKYAETLSIGWSWRFSPKSGFWVYCIWRTKCLGFPPKTIGNHISWDSTLVASFVNVCGRLRSVEQSTCFVWQIHLADTQTVQCC